MLAAQTAATFKGLGELHGGVEPLACRLVQQHSEDDIVLAQTFGVELRADLFAHQALVHRVQLDPATRNLIDQLAGQRGAIAQLDFEAALGAVLVGPVHEQPRGVKAAQRTGAGEGQKGVVLYLMFGGLAGVVGQNDTGVRIDRFAQNLYPVPQEEHHGGVVVLAATIRPTIEEVMADGLVIDLRTDGIAGVMRDLMTPRQLEAAE